VFKLVFYFYLEWKEIFEKINKNVCLFLKNKNKDRKNNFYTLKKLEKNDFHEIRAKKVRYKMDQQQNGQRQNGQRQSGRAKKTCFRNYCPK